MKILPKARRLALLAFVSVFMPRGLSAQFPPLSGDAPVSRIMENAEVRQEWIDTWLRLSPENAMAFKPRVISTDSGPVKLETIRRGNFFYQAVINGRNGAFSQYSQGTWIFKRRIADGAWIQAKVFLRSDPGTFLRLYPAGTRSNMDIIVFGSVVRQAVTVPVPFSQPLMAAIPETRNGDMTILTLPIASVMSLTKDGFPWSSFDPDPDLSSAVRTISAFIRASLGSLEYLDDAAFDDDGNTFIRSGAPIRPESGKIGLNCSGFVKWIADSILSGMGKQTTVTESLRERREESRGNSFSKSFEEEEDPYFGLDWTRNLAKAFHERLYPARKNNLADFDVRDSFFALRAEIKDVLNTLPEYEDYPNYVENQGFRVDGLKCMLYLLAVNDPGSFYVGAFNKEEVIKKDAKGRTISLRKFYHTAAFFPYFLPTGEFRVDVFESCAETDFDALIAAKGTEYIHLVRFPAEGSFIPFGIRLE